MGEINEYHTKSAQHHIQKCPVPRFTKLLQYFLRWESAVPGPASIPPLSLLQNPFAFCLFYQASVLNCVQIPA